MQTVRGSSFPILLLNDPLPEGSPCAALLSKYLIQCAGEGAGALTELRRQ